MTRFAGIRKECSSARKKTGLVVVFLYALYFLTACSTQSPRGVIPVESKKPSATTSTTSSSNKASSPAVSKDSAELLPSAARLLQESRSALAAGEISVASAKAERALRISPKSPEVYSTVAAVRLQEKKYAQAEQMLMKAMSLAGANTPVRSKLWLQVAEVRNRAGDRAGAEDARKRAATEKW